MATGGHPRLDITATRLLLEPAVERTWQSFVVVLCFACALFQLKLGTAIACCPSAMRICMFGMGPLRMLLQMLVCVCH